MKSKNFKLIKKLAVYDTFNQSLPLQQANRKRIGTLHVTIELSSDLNQFNVDLIKLKNFEQKQGSKPVKRTQQSPVRQPQPHTETIPTSSRNNFDTPSYQLESAQPKNLTHERKNLAIANSTNNNQLSIERSMVKNYVIKPFFFIKSLLIIYRIMFFY